jgi:hypothetical protein
MPNVQDADSATAPTTAQSVEPSRMDSETLQAITPVGPNRSDSLIGDQRQADNASGIQCFWRSRRGENRGRVIVFNRRFCQPDLQRPFPVFRFDREAAGNLSKAQVTGS